jgi:hypothetical protein
MPLKLLIQQIHPNVRVERDSGMCVARDLYELQHATQVCSTRLNNHLAAPLEGLGKSSGCKYVTSASPDV